MELEKHYYLADGQKIDLLKAENFVAVDEKDLANPGISPSTKAAVQKLAKRLSKDVWLVDYRSMTPELDAAIRELAEPQPVFRSQQALIVPRPEVRVEETRPDKQALLKTWLQAHQSEIRIVSHQGDRFVLAPASGQGQDALAMANALAVEVDPELAQARFLRVVNFKTT